MKVHYTNLSGKLLSVKKNIAYTKIDASSQLSAHGLNKYCFLHYNKTIFFCKNYRKHTKKKKNMERKTNIVG